MARILGCSGGSVKWVPGTSYSGGRGTTSPGRALAVPLPAHLLQPCDPAARTGVCSQYRWPVWNYVAPFGHPICRSRHVTALAPRSRAQRSRRESAAVCVRAGGTRPACAGSVRCRRRAALVALSPDGCKFGDAGGLSGQFHLPIPSALPALPSRPSLAACRHRGPAGSAHTRSTLAWVREGVRPSISLHCHREYSQSNGGCNSETPGILVSTQFLKELRRQCGGEGGIRTHVPGSSPDKALSRRPRYGHFGTSPGLVGRFALQAGWERPTATSGRGRTSA